MSPTARSALLSLSIALTVTAVGACSLDASGVFLHADLAWKDKDPEGMIAAAGFAVTSVEDITGNVLESLELDNSRREAIVASFPAHMQNDFRDWSGVRGFRAYNRFKSREWIYRCIRARR